MSIARRGIFGVLAALPFAPNAAAPAEDVQVLRVALGTSDIDEFLAAFERSYLTETGRGAHLFPGERLVTWGADVLNDRIEIAPYGWDTLENVR